VFQAILYEKSKDTAGMVPYFLYPCLSSYCEANNCFKLQNKGGVSSTIFDTIKVELGKGNTNGYSSLRDLVLGVFCVLNLSRKANNPPPTPYINTSDVYYAINNSKIVGRIYKPLMELRNEIKRLLKVPIANQFPPNQVKTIGMSPDMYIQFEGICGRLAGKDKETITNKDMQLILQVLDHLDTISAASAIGTVQFVDKLSKFNSTKAMCSYNNIECHPRYTTLLGKLKFQDVINGNSLDLRYLTSPQTIGASTS
jgi:hypothetical protein